MRYGNARASTRPESTVVTGCEEQTLEMAISVNSNRRPRAARFLGRSGLGLRPGPLIIAVQSRQAQRWRGPCWQRARRLQRAATTSPGTRTRISSADTLIVEIGRASERE